MLVMQRTQWLMKNDTNVLISASGKPAEAVQKPRWKRANGIVGVEDLGYKLQ